MKLEYVVVVPSELSAGIRGFTDEVTVELKDWNSDNETVWLAQEHFRQAIAEWYDGGKVSTKEEANEREPDEGDLLSSDDWEKQS